MARFDERATTPGCGPGDILRWKLGKKEPRPEDFAALDAFRLAVRGGGAEALAGTAPVAGCGSVTRRGRCGSPAS